MPKTAARLIETPRRKRRAERIVVKRFACKFLVDEWDVELEFLGRANAPRRSSDDGDGSLMPVVFAV